MQTNGEKVDQLVENRWFKLIAQSAAVVISTTVMIAAPFIIRLAISLTDTIHELDKNTARITSVIAESILPRIERAEEMSKQNDLYIRGLEQRKVNKEDANALEQRIWREINRLYPRP